MTTESQSNSGNAFPELEDYYPSETGFLIYLRDLADELFPFPGYRDGQGEALHEALEALYINGCQNVVLDLPTGVGKSPLNVTVAAVSSYLARNQQDIEERFDVSLNLNRGKDFYTTPQKSLRDQLANDSDINDAMSMLKARADYTCGATGEPCDTCPVKSDPERSCLDEPGCTYWQAKWMQEPTI